MYSCQELAPNIGVGYIYILIVIIKHKLKGVMREKDRDSRYCEEREGMSMI